MEKIGTIVFFLRGTQHPRLVMLDRQTNGFYWYQKRTLQDKAMGTQSTSINNPKQSTLLVLESPPENYESTQRKRKDVRIIG